MGTRHLIAVVKDGEFKIAQYGQWDGYPSGQGSDILEFVSDDQNIKALKDALPRARFLEPAGRDKEFCDAYEKNAPEWSSDPDNRTDAQKHWFESYMTRNLGSQILPNIANSPDNEILIKNSISFAGDSLFCEWAYVVDLDDNVFEVYEGFNKEPIVDGRFKSSDFELEGGYHPVKLVKAYPFNELPNPAQFVAELEPEEE